MDDDRGPVSFLGRPLPAWVELRLVEVAPGAAKRCDDDAWHDALVVVERGEVELQDAHGGCRRCAPGEVLWLAGLPLHAIHNRGSRPALLAAVARRRVP
ncbi:cupin domain-containing protein [Conexibacter woesei]|uniref:Cupin 2 conserved barrel domain protein n=1 Tax=Conexibacter woesei (strain DSM 14684 / CCUG 47730 / CIP 108061 / JCM 11494 / NBRC 100937 / ID131577) TaxID=469383 RepID=D3F7M2_CONWI|nr:hypothetical protein [Conexibacter woesei]ADB50884.1 hypothetical protein Cwoe_2461 [Conexibacter woesei DSM 14684]